MTGMCIWSRYSTTMNTTRSASLMCFLSWLRTCCSTWVWYIPEKRWAAWQISFEISGSHERIDRDRNGLHKQSRNVCTTKSTETSMTMIWLAESKSQLKFQRSSLLRTGQKWRWNTCTKYCKRYMNQESCEATFLHGRYHQWSWDSAFTAFSYSQACDTYDSLNAEQKTTLCTKQTISRSQNTRWNTLHRNTEANQRERERWIGPLEGRKPTEHTFKGKGKPKKTKNRSNKVQTAPAYWAHDGSLRQAAKEEGSKMKGQKNEVNSICAVPKQKGAQKESTRKTQAQKCIVVKYRTQRPLDINKINHKISRKLP